MIKFADIPVNILDGFSKWPRVTLAVSCIAAGLGISSAFSQSGTGIAAMAAVLLAELVAAWFIGRPAK